MSTSINIKNLASYGDSKNWSAFACSGNGQGKSVRAEVSSDFVVLTVEGQEYECNTPSRISVGDIRNMMINAVHQHNQAACAA